MWTHDKETGEDVWLLENPTIAELARVAGSISEIAEACGVCARTVSYWRAGKTKYATFRSVATMARMAGVEPGKVRL